MSISLKTRMNFEDIAQFDTGLTADVVQWRPSTNTLACATYYLNKELNERVGRIYLLDYLNESELCVKSQVEFTGSGILDMQWINADYMLTVDSKNTVDIFKYNDDFKLEAIEKILLNTSDANEPSLGLAFDFLKSSTNTYGVSKIVSSSSNGRVSVINFNETGVEHEVSCEFHAHDYEVWCVKFDEYDENIIYSGADDSLLKLWDLRQGTNRCVQKTAFFNGGVCSILQSPQNESHILCGSYDEQIYLVDKRNVKNYVQKSDKLGGGVWKMRLNKSKDLILCACMHKGAYLIDFDTLTSKLFYDKHNADTVVYGCDWKDSDGTSQNSNVIATCAFYSHEVRVWKVNYN